MRRTLLLLSLVAGTAPALAEPVALRPHSLVAGPVVTLGDLFENAGPRATQSLGAAPAPGQRWLLEAPQLSLIARDFGLDWRPLSGGERSVVERPGRALRRETLVAALLPELQALGARPDLDVDLVGFTPPFLPEAAPEPQLVMEGTTYDPSSHRFASTMLLVAEGMPPLRQRIAGRLAAMRTVVVATRPLRVDTLIGAGDVALQRVPADQMRSDMAESPDAVLGARLKRAVAAERPLSLTDLAVPAAMRKDASVTLQHEVPGLSILAPGRALEDGAIGAAIPVLNLATGTVVMAQVLGPGRVSALGPAPPTPARRASH